MPKIKSGFLAALAAFALALVAFGASAQDSRIASNEPTVAQIYQAANSGNLDRADAMVDEVLKSHPNSAKAHYVKAEISARQGKTDAAKQELAKAEQIAPGLPFVKPESAQALRNQLARPATAATAAPAQPRTRQMGAPADAPRAAEQRSFPWGTLAIVAGIVLIGIAVLRRRNAAVAPAGDGGAYGNTSAVPYGQPGYGPGYPPNAGVPPGYPPQQASMGSSIARGVGTGLAMGAGMVAAQEIGHRMFGHGDAHAAGLDSNAGNVNTPSLDQIDDGMRHNLNSDMGGAEFGVNDGGGWDGGGGDIGGGGGDWDT
ncbi:MAG TPA: tetratricopeptide repeat protein [Ramlibacter sp.]|nr:tetratricopeptide repeat protein [Ramlibacter sp.]